tara:strand:- start:1136 stop:2785 length:1650 start_codon:yes stop_codon:yes gene_type:complete
MSISSDNDAVQRKANEDYREAISSKEKKHQQELKRVREQHYEAMRTAQAQHEKRTEALRSSMNEKMSDRDQYYQEQIDKMNEMHRKRLRDLANDYSSQLKNTKEHASSEIQENTKIQQRQRANLEEKYQNEIKRMDKNFRDFAEYNRNKQEEALETERVRHLDYHQEKMSAKQKSHEDIVENMRNSLYGERVARRNMERQLKSRMSQQDQTSEENFRRTLERERRLHDKNMTNQHLSHQESIDNVKEKYQKAIREYIESREGANEDYVNRVGNRMQNKIESLEQRLADTEQEANSQRILDKKRGDIQKNQLRREMKNSNELLEEQKRLALEDMSDKHKAEMFEQEKQHEKALHNRIRFYQGNINKMYSDHKEHVGDKEQLHSFQMQQSRQVADDRVDNIRQQSAEEEKIRNEYYRETVEQLKHSHQKDKLDLQNEMMSERRAAISELSDKMTELQMKHDREQAQLKKNYEKQISNLNFNHQKDKSTMTNKHKQVVEDLQTSHKRQLEQYKVSQEAKLAKIKEQHRLQIERMQNRHVREMEELAQAKPKA